MQPKDTMAISHVREDLEEGILFRNVLRIISASKKVFLITIFVHLVGQSLFLSVS